VYIGPTKSLCQQKAQDWNRRLSKFGMRCTPFTLFRGLILGGELTGDSEGSDISIVKGNDVLVTTPEKWDSFTRKFKDFARRTISVDLLMV